MQICTDCFW